MRFVVCRICQVTSISAPPSPNLGTQCDAMLVRFALLFAAAAAAAADRGAKNTLVLDAGAIVGVQGGVKFPVWQGLTLLHVGMYV